MTLVSVLLALAIDRMTLWHRDRGLDQTMPQLLEAIARRLPSGWDGIGGGLLLVLPPVLVMGLLQWLVAGWLFGLVGIVLAVTVLVFMLGPLDIVNSVDDYIDARRAEDSERSGYFFRRVTGEAPPESPAEEGRWMARAVFHQGHDHLFGTLFWFCVLGPMGAVFHRVAAEAALNPGAAISARPALARAARDIFGVLCWIPARLLAFGYAMTGSFEAALQQLRAGARPVAGDWLRGSQLLLADTGAAAMRSGDEANGDPYSDTATPRSSERRSSDPATAVDAARALVMRAVVFWLAILALLTLAGWLS
jgi:AmpE protein